MTNAKKAQPDARTAPLTRAVDADTGKSGNLLAELRAGEAGAPEAVPPPPRPRRRVSTSNVIFGTVIAVSVGALYAMRLYGMSSGITFATVPIDYELGGISERVRAEQARVLRDLARSNEPMHAAAEKISKNPFTLDDDIETVVGRGPLGPSPEDLAALEEKDRQTRINETLASIKLHSVMRGRVPLARINDAIFREGDIVAELFTVKAIHDRSVEIEVDGKIYAVSMSEPEIKRKP
ncbi:MAG: hypothetical protein ACKVU4_15705 [Phycisphaerales bacterium]